MLLDIRDGIRNSKWLKYVIVGIICVPFALFGINSYFGGHGPDYAAKVNGQKVSLNAYQDAYQQTRAQLAQQFGGSLPQGLNIGSIVNSQTMDTVVRQEVLRQSTVNNGFAIGDEDLAREIFTEESFAEDGTFSKDRYNRQLQSLGYTATQFEEQFRSSLLLQQLRDGIITTGFALSDENEHMQNLRLQQRAVSYITLSTQAKAETIEVTDDEISTHYDANIASFNNPEKIKVEYLELKIDDLKGTLDTNDEDLQAYFEQNKNQWVVAEKRAASHILLALDADASDSDAEDKLAEANALLERIKGGETLASIAPTISDDPGSAENGGSLGEFGRGVMVPEFEQVAFEMAEGEVSEPVRSDFGYHIIQLDRIISEQGQPFEEVKAEVTDQYLTERAVTKYFEASELLSNASYENSDSLQPAADESGLTLQTSDWIDRNSTEGLGAFPQVISAALTDDVLNNGINSEVLQVGENHAVVLRTIEHEDAKPKALEEVREDIITLVQNEKASEELQALADTLITQLEGGAEAATLATDNSGEFTETVSVSRADSDTDRAIVQRLFTMPKPTEGTSTYSKLTNTAGDVVVVAFSGVDVSSPEAEEGAEVETPKATQAPAFAEFNALIDDFEEQAEVERNDALLEPAGYQ